MIYIEKTDEVKKLLKQFKLNGKDAPVYVTQYETLTPDSCVWRLTEDLEFLGDAGKQYVLYAEDYIPSLDHVHKIIEAWAKSPVSHFVGVKKPKQFSDAGPVKAATTYTPPEDQQEMMKYAGENGFYFVFLAELADA